MLAPGAIFTLQFCPGLKMRYGTALIPLPFQTGLPIQEMLE